MLENFVYDLPVKDQIDRWFAIEKISYKCGRCKKKEEVTGYQQRIVTSQPDYLFISFDESLQPAALELPQDFELYDYMDTIQKLRGILKDGKFYTLVAVVAI